MSTAWYIVDEDGNVGILEFGDNGPVPFGTPHERAIEQIVLGDMYSREGSVTMKENQICSFLGNEDDCFSDIYCIVEIDPSRTSEFQEIIQKSDLVIATVVSEKYGLYILDYAPDSDYSDYYIDQLKEKGIILKFHRLPEYYMFDEFENGRFYVSKSFSDIPYYMYLQSDSVFHPQCRAYIPEYPIHISQLSQELRDRALKIPVKFSEAEYIQIANWYPGSLESAEKEEILINNFRYSLHYDEKGSKYYYFSGFWDFGGMTNEILFLTWQPRVAVWSNNHINWDYNNHFNEIYTSKAVILSNKSIPNEEIIDFFKPNVIIVEIEAMDYFESIHKIEKHKTTINGTEYPVYYDAEIDEFKDEILALSNMPYRGPVAPLKISYKEGQKILRHKNN